MNFNKKSLLIILIISSIMFFSSCQNEEKNNQQEEIEVQIPKKTKELKVILDIPEESWQNFHNEILFDFERYNDCKVYPFQFDTVDLLRKLCGMREANNMQVDLFIIDYDKVMPYFKENLVTILEAHKDIIPDNIYPSFIDVCKQIDYNLVLSLIKDIDAQKRENVEKIEPDIIFELEEACRNFDYDLAVDILHKFSEKISSTYYKLIKDALTKKVLCLIPYRFDTKINIINKEISQKNTLSLPKNYEELINYIDINEKNHPPKRSFLFAESPTSITNTLTELLISIKEQFSSLDDELIDNLILLLNSLELELLKDEENARQLFKENKTVIIRDWASKNIPKNEEETNNKIYDNLLSGNLLKGKVLVLTKGSKNKKLAIKLIEYLMSNTIQKKLVYKFGFLGLMPEIYDIVEPFKENFFKAVAGAFSNSTPITEISKDLIEGAYKKFISNRD